LERLAEIWDNIRNHKLRTFLTGFSVAWGIFMLVVLLGVGSGLQNGTKQQFADDAINSIFVRPGQTSLPFEGLLPGRFIRLDNDDYDAVKREIAGVDQISSRYEKWTGYTMRYGDRTASFNMRGVHPDHQYIEKTEMIQGRYINDRDIEERRKICVIGDQIVQDLLEGGKALGEWISVNGIPYQIVGVFVDEGNEGENGYVYLPISTAQLAYGGSLNIDQIIFTTGDVSLEQTNLMVEEVKEMMSKNHHFDPADPRALHVRNNFENYSRISNVLDLMKLFFWLIGILTVVAGIVGVSNIMIITVQERTREIGIRKSLGATPRSILVMIMQESIFITALFGYLGLFSGIFLLELVAKFLPDNGAVFANPTVDFNTAFTALILLIVSGTAAGLIPAMKAARIKPVEALMDE
jgi:putative ABC transport system permease protein